jgi:hypothetical protein
LKARNAAAFVIQKPNQLGGAAMPAACDTIQRLGAICKHASLAYMTELN